MRTIHNNLAVCRRIVHLRMVQVGVTTAAAPNSSNLAPLVPIEYYRACAPPEDKLLVDNCFDRGDSEDGERCEIVVEPVRFDTGHVYDPEVTPILARAPFV